MNARDLSKTFLDEETFWSVIACHENISQGGRIRLTPQEELFIAFCFCFNEVFFQVLADESGGIARATQWLSDNSVQILEQMNESSFANTWMSLPDRAKFVCSFIGEVLDRFASTTGNRIAERGPSGGHP